VSGFLVSGIVLVMLILIGYGAHRFSRMAGERDWIYNKHNPRPRGGGTLGLLEEIYQPSIQYVVEERSSQKARGSQNESGDKPTPGSGPDHRPSAPRPQQNA
jgi:hypothetical protein